MASGRFKVKILYPDYVYKCNHCDYEIKNKRGLDLHLKVEHGIDRKTPPPPANPKFGVEFLCCSCGKSFSTMNILEYHKKTYKHFV